MRSRLCFVTISLSFAPDRGAWALSAFGLIVVKSCLRTVPTIVIAHTFRASPDTRISYCQCLLIQGYFCVVENYPEKVGLSKYSWYPKKKLGVTKHF